ncbi:non-LTR reverse transcriptase [Striga asiatica]|uniref:Non-LTR reverse transcriptase n=1 Tax=Striga asiatica TaxID=4170 RepID=A0A5A7Q224_STRAF|nr:non-LTR reverse transcriptase [Striga asiatica]
MTELRFASFVGSGREKIRPGSVSKDLIGKHSVQQPMFYTGLMAWWMSERSSNGDVYKGSSQTELLSRVAEAELEELVLSTLAAFFAIASVEWLRGELKLLRLSAMEMVLHTEDLSPRSTKEMNEWKTARGIPNCHAGFLYQHSLQAESKTERRVSIACLFETKASGVKAEDAIRSIGMKNSHRVEAVGFSGGILRLWNSNVTVKILKNDWQFVHFQVTFNNNQSIFMTAVYGSPRSALRPKLEDNLSCVADDTTGPWLLLGDFNAILEAQDKIGGLYD